MKKKKNADSIDVLWFYIIFILHLLGRTSSSEFSSYVDSSTNRFILFVIKYIYLQTFIVETKIWIWYKIGLTPKKHNAAKMHPSKCNVVRFLDQPHQTKLWVSYNFFSLVSNFNIKDFLSIFAWKRKNQKWIIKIIAEVLRFFCCLCLMHENACIYAMTIIWFACKRKEKIVIGFCFAKFDEI